MKTKNLTTMTDAMFRIPYRLMELPFLMSAAAIDSLLAGRGGMTKKAERRGVSHRQRRAHIRRRRAQARAA
jgi:hypothetical protein